MGEEQQASQVAGEAASLRAVAWQRFLNGPGDGLGRRLYEPALSRAVRYDRCCAYFSSTVLAAAARGFGAFIQNLQASEPDVPKPAIRLLVNEQLDPPDLKALLTRGDASRLAQKLLRQFKTPEDLLAKARLQALAWLVAAGWLEVRVGLMRNTGGVLHAKFGVVTDRQGDSIAFMGSGNETGQAITQNYEELVVGWSWEDPGFTDRYRARFEALWEGNDPDVAVVPLPEAVRQKLIRLAPSEPPKGEPRPDVKALKAAMRWHFIAAAPYLPNGEAACDATMPVDLWPHQRRVVEDTARAFPAGRLLCDEVGMGKTIEAIAVLRRLLAGRGVRRALLLVPAGLMEQWQSELREKGGLLVPRWKNGILYLPEGGSEPVEAGQALRGHDLLLLSREWARLSNNRELVLTAPEWDLVLMDEAHAARRLKPEEGEFNSGNLLLELLRELQLRRRTRGILLLSATPMQTQPWEPWDLLATLGVGGKWQVDFADIRAYYEGIEALRNSTLLVGPKARAIARLVVGDEEFPDPPPEAQVLRDDAESLASALAFSPEQPRCAEWLQAGAPLGRRMHRNTRDTLHQYHRMGLLRDKPPQRDVRDVVFDFEDARERECYEAIEHYIDRRYEQLEQEKPGKGFVMTIYRRRAASSPRAFQRSLRRRLERLEAIIQNQSYRPWLGLDEEQLDIRDLGDTDSDEEIDPGLPQTADGAKAEKEEVERLLGMLGSLGNTDSKFARFQSVLEEVTGDGRSVLVFTEYTDTMVYLRDQLAPIYRSTLGCFSGEGGQVWQHGEWQPASKAEIAQRLADGKLRVLVCTDAASEGLNLQAASALINYDLPWNPSKVEQRIGRIDRIGQAQDVLPVRNLFLADSVDMAVYKALRLRCGLFERFVGHMQPVLALAHKRLREGLRRGELGEFIRQLEQEEQKAREAAAVVYAFPTSEAHPVPKTESPVTREDIEGALAALKEGVGNVKATPVRGQRKWRLRGLGGGSVEVTIDREPLEQDGRVLPLTALDGVALRLCERLPLTGDVPLVLAEHAEGPFRCVEARWVGVDRTVPVTSARQLADLLEGWTGKPAEEQALQAARDEASRSARERVEQMRRAVLGAEKAGLRRQHEAARLRLLRALARTLRCAGQRDLNDLFRHQISQEDGEDGRYHRALTLLGGFPQWTADQIADADAFAEGLTPTDRRNQVALPSVLDAALRDPRWRAACAVGRLH